MASNKKAQILAAVMCASSIFGSYTMVSAESSISGNMAFSGLCFAADGNDLNKEQKVAETFMEVFTKDQIPAYDVVSKDFSDTLKTNVNEKAYKDLSKQIKEQYGNVKEVKFYNFQRFDQGDRVTYVAAFDKEQAVAIMLAFDKDKKLTDYVFTPLQVEEASK